jgi:hypothetical protein
VQLSAWRAITPLPHALESALALLVVIFQDNSPQTSRSYLSLRQSYATAIIRLVNGLVDPLQSGTYARSIASIAVQLGLPRWLVELRHAATHEDLPSLELLREAAREVCAAICAISCFPESISSLLVHVVAPSPLFPSYHQPILNCSSTIGHIAPLGTDFETVQKPPQNNLSRCFSKSPVQASDKYHSQGHRAMDSRSQGGCECRRWRVWLGHLRAFRELGYRGSRCQGEVGLGEVLRCTVGKGNLGTTFKKVNLYSMLRR